MPNLDFSHLITFIVGFIVGGGITYTISTKISYRGGNSQKNISAGRDFIGGNKEDKK